MFAGGEVEDAIWADEHGENVPGWLAEIETIPHLAGRSPVPENVLLIITLDSESCAFTPGFAIPIDDMRLKAWIT